MSLPVSGSSSAGLLASAGDFKSSLVQKERDLKSLKSLKRISLLDCYKQEVTSSSKHRIIYNPVPAAFK